MYSMLGLYKCKWKIIKVIIINLPIPDFMWTCVPSQLFSVSTVSWRTTQRSAQLIPPHSPTARQKSLNEPETVPRPQIGRIHLQVRYYSATFEFGTNIHLGKGENLNKCCQYSVIKAK